MPVLESIQDLREIPVRAILAYASRSARRVQHLFCVDSQQPEAEACTLAIETALRLCEEFANGAEIDPQLVSQTESETIRTLQLAMEADPVDKGAAYSANAAYAVINALQVALEVEDSPDNMQAVAERIVESATIARDASVAANPSISHAVEMDWEKLRRMHLGKFPDWGECIDATESGILGSLSCGSHEDSSNQNTADGRDPAEDNSTDCVMTDVPAESEGAPGEAFHQQNEPRSSEERPEQQETEEDQTSPDPSVVHEQVQVERLREDQEQLEQEREALRSQEDAFRFELNAFRSEQEAFLSLREALAAEQEKWLAEREALAGEQEKLQAERQLVDEERAALERDASQQGAELAKERSQFEAEREALAAEQESLQALRDEVQHRNSEGQLDQDNFVALQDQLSRQRSKLQLQKEKLQAKLSGLREKRLCLRKDRTRIEADAKQLARQKQELAEKGDDLEQLQQELDQQRAELQSGQTDLLSGREKWQAEACALEAEQQKFQQRVTAFEQQQQQFEQDTTSIEQARRNLQNEKKAVEQKAATLESDRADWESQTATLQRDREEIEARHEELQKECESLQAIRATLQQEKARLAGLEADIQESNRQLTQQTSQHLDGDELADRLHDLKTSTESGDELQTLLGQMVEERQQLLNERAEMTEDLAQLQHLRSQPSADNDESFVDENAPEQNRASLQPLRVILDPGTASSLQLGALLGMLTELYRQLGGPGVCYDLSRTTSWNIEEPGAHPLDESRGDQNYAEIIASPRATMAGSDVEADGRAWERFEWCLRMVLKTDAGLADFLELGVAVPSDHRTCQMVAEAAQRGSTADDCHSNSLEALQAEELPVDCIHLQLQRIDELRGSLEHEQRMFLELAPAIDCDENSPASGAESALTPPAKRRRRKRVRKILLAVAALAAIVIGACCW